MNTMTISDFIERLKDYPVDTPCCGEIWLAEDFLQLDERLTADEVWAAMLLADKRHDANVGYNWDFFQCCIDQILQGRGTNGGAHPDDALQGVHHE